MRLIAGLLLAAFLVQVALGLAVKSGTCDELGAHVPAGILAWKSGRLAGGLANPPLGQLLVAAGPVVAGTADRPLRQDPRGLLPARLPVVLLGLATVLATGALGRRLGGPLAGLAALGAAALSPNLVAHSRLATLDLPVTAFVTLAALAAWSWARTRQPAVLLAWAVAAGIACLVKHSALHLLPAVTVGALLAGRPGEGRLRSSLVLAAAAVLGVLGVAWLSYGPGSGSWLLPAGYVDGLLTKWEHGRAGHFAYLLGRRSASGFAGYYLVALLVKVPLALLVAAGVGVVTLARGRARGDARGFVAFGVVPALWILLAMSLLHRVNVGVRHVLPLWPVLLALAGLGWARLWEHGRAARMVAAGLAAWTVGAAVSITPDHLAYFNELAGGPDRGDRILIDSNLDWGQDEGRLRAWARGRDVAVNPERPVSGLVAANVNALRGILSPDDSRLRWLTAFEPMHRIGHTWRIFRTSEEPLRSAAARSPLGALDYASWLTAQDRPAEAIAVLERNDLSAHEGHAREWWDRLAEARLAVGDLPGALAAAPRSGDADLAVEIAYRLSEVRAVPWEQRDPRERRAVYGALMRRGHPGEAHELAIRVRREHPADAFPEFGMTEADPETLSPEARLTQARVWRQLGQEARALEAVGALLARQPEDEAALWLYGELVVRRKLGLTEYPWPRVDWSGITRRSAAALP